MKGTRIFLTLVMMTLVQSVAGAPSGAKNSRSLEATNVSSDQPASLSETTPIVTVQVGDATLHVPKAYIDSADGFQGKFGYLKIRALLPCLAPETPENTAEFHRTHWASIVVARLSVWDIHELTGEKLLAIHIENNKSVKHLRLHPTTDEEDNIDLPQSDFHMYKDDLLGMDIFFRNDAVSTFVLQCWRHSDVARFPSCSSRSVVEKYFLLDYEYSRSFIDQSIEESLAIDARIKRLFLSFLLPGNQTTVSTTGACK